MSEGRLAASPPDPAEVYEAAIRYLTGIPEVASCALFLLSASRRDLAHVFSHGYAPFPVPLTLPVEGGSVIAQVARTGTRRLTRDVPTDPNHGLGRPDTRSELAIPLTAGGEVVGVLNLESTKADAFSPAVVSLCESVASGISAAFQGPSTP